MDSYLDYLWMLLGQFAGGPGPKENNLVRFGLPAVLWAVLFFVAWSRQRQQKLPRERLLVWGFGLAFARELFMFYHVSSQLVLGVAIEFPLHYTEPVEHALTMAAVLMVAGAFLRYILDDAALTRRYLQIGLVTTILLFGMTWWWWHQHATANPDSRFNQTWGGVIFYAVTGVFAAIAIGLLARKRGWLRNVVFVALGFYVLIGVGRVLNLLTDRAFAYMICPVCNSLHILAIPLLGYVYIREQSIEKRQAEDALEAYRDHLEDLVEERTTELTWANEHLQLEISERNEAERQIARRNSELAAQNAIAATISRSLDLETILHTAMDMVLAVLEMEAGCIYLLEPDGVTLTLYAWRCGSKPGLDTPHPGKPCSCVGISHQAVVEMKPVVVDVTHFEDDCVSACVVDESLRILISTPLTSKDRPVGALALGCRHRDRLTTQEVEMLTAIGQQVGMAVDNARLHHETERWAEELALLHESSVILTATLDPATIYHQLAEQAAKLLGCQVATIFRWDEEARQAVGVFSYGLDGSGIKDLPVQSDEGVLFQELVDQHGSIAIEDALADARIPPLWRAQFKIQALLCLPLLGKDRTLGFLFLVDQTGPRRWHTNEVAWAESFVNNAAMALENAYLYEQAERAATLEERQRIAADMHDGLAQTLSYLGLKAYHATELLEEGRTQEVFDHHADIQSAIERASTEVRQSISSLQESPPPRRPLQVWLAEIVGSYAKNGGPSAELISEVTEPLFVPSKQIEQVSRVVQEALLNAGRHARAQRIVVRLERVWDEIRVTVEDDGQGFDLDSPPQDGRDHFGLSIMRARAARIGARLKIDTAPGRGTRVSLTWSPQDRATNSLPGMTRLVSEGLVPRRQIVPSKE